MKTGHPHFLGRKIVQMFIATLPIPEVNDETALVIRESLIAAVELLTDEELLASLEPVPDGDGDVCVLVARCL